MIYDRNQFTFNLILVALLAAAVLINVLYARNLQLLDQKFADLNTSLAKLEADQAFNFIQGGRTPIAVQQTPDGLLVPDATDYGRFYGPSMQPAIFDNNLLIEKAYDGKSRLSAGHIVRFLRSDGTAVIHRVRADYGEEVFVQGDSLREGEIVPKSSITHQVIGVLYS